MEYYAHCGKAGSNVVEKAGDNGWDTKRRKRCTGRGEGVIWIALFFPLGFDELAHDSGYGREQIERDQGYTTSLLPLSSYAENYWKGTPNNPDSTEFHTITHLHWKAHSYLEGYCDNTEEAKAEEI